MHHADLQATGYKDTAPTIEDQRFSLELEIPRTSDSSSQHQQLQKHTLPISAATA